MNKEELMKIKEKALEDHIPIIMDDTLEVIAEILTKIKPEKILEIGAAVGYSAMCFSEYLQDGGKIDTIERDEERILVHSRKPGPLWGGSPEDCRKTCRGDGPKAVQDTALSAHLQGYRNEQQADNGCHQRGEL